MIMKFQLLWSSAMPAADPLGKEAGLQPPKKQLSITLPGETLT